ncbi:hypothetical protein [Anabaena sp. CCY 9402-a]
MKDGLAPSADQYKIVLELYQNMAIIQEKFGIILRFVKYEG